MLILNQIKLLRAGKLLFTDVGLSFYQKQKIGLIGRNGSGKSSLFSLILKELQPDDGTIEISFGAKVIHLEQEIPTGECSAVEYVIDGDIKLREAERKLHEIEKVCHDGMVIAKAHAYYDQCGGYSAYSRAASLLAGLGISPLEQNKTINQLSGGLRRRLNLARALFVASDILLLDEPTNHLDIESVIWLENFLQKYPGIILLISHDRDFLDNVVSTIIEIEQQKITSYSGNYSNYELLKAQKAKLQQKKFEEQQQKAVHLKEFIQRFQAKASKAKQAQSRIKALKKMELAAPMHLLLPFSFEFYHVPVPDVLLTLSNIDFAYGEQLIFQKLNVNIEAKMRVGLLGPNGIGKSTLIKLLTGELGPTSGIREINKKTRIGYFAQHQLDQLDLTASPLVQLQRIALASDELTLRKFLGGFNFSGDKATSVIDTFSGGEKARLALALIVWQKPNLLLLDEPTNHLDLEMREALTLALQSYEGALLVVSHDRHLLRSTVDSFLVITNKNVLTFDGDLDDYQSWLATLISVAKPKPLTGTITKTSISKSKNRLIKIEQELDSKYLRLKAVEQELLMPEIFQKINQERLKQLLLEQKQLQQKCEELEEEWLG